MSSTKAPAMKQRLNKRQFLRHPKRRSWRMSKIKE